MEPISEMWFLYRKLTDNHKNNIEHQDITTVDMYLLCVTKINRA